MKSNTIKLPRIIQGGMGVSISNWRLAKAVAQKGQMGVVSGTGLGRVLTSRLRDGDLAGHMRRALESFALPEAVQAVLRRYFIPGGKAPGAPYLSPPAYSLRPPRFLDRLTAIANYVEIFLAREDHAGLVGINLLEKIQLPTLASLYGAMLAGVDYVLMGAGIPTQVAGILDRLAHHLPVSYRLDVHGADPGEEIRIHFDPEAIFPGIAGKVGPLKRPGFLPIISSAALAQALLRRSEGALDGFVIEGPTAGGHNAPPRGPLTLNARGEPVYGEKDVVDPEKMMPFGLPFWLAGGYGRPARLREALEAGAAGVQVGTAFALCEESGMDPALKQRLLRQVLDEQTDVLTSAVASPTGFPFKVARLEGTLSEQAVYDSRQRVCDLGFLRTIFKRLDGSFSYRCPAEPVPAYVAKGGRAEETDGRACLCNALAATAGFPQNRKGGWREPPLVTSGDDLAAVGQFLRPGRSTYTAADVIDALLSLLPAAGLSAAA